MVDIRKLLKALPVTGLEPEPVASLCGFVEVPEGQRWREHVEFLGPPAGQRFPYLDPVDALAKLLWGQSISDEEALSQAVESVNRMRQAIAPERWVPFFDSFDPRSPERVPVPDFIAWIRSQELVAPDVADFFDRALEVTVNTPMFWNPENWDRPWSIANLPDIPPATAMIEFVPGAPWGDIDHWTYEEGSDNPFLRWREGIRPIATALEQALGEPLYYFADLDDHLDDDTVHRFLVLHWCCTHQPESPFVRYLVSVSGAEDVEELMDALVDPANYADPFKMNGAFRGIEALPCKFQYLPPGIRKNVTVILMTLEARRIAERTLSEQIGAYPCIVGPKDLLTDDWIRHATRHCANWAARYVFDRRIDNPIEILATTDELYVVADAPSPKSGFDLMLADSVENLFLVAQQYGIPAKYLSIDGRLLFNPETSLEKRGVAQRVEQLRENRATFTRELFAMRVANDYGSSGLWSENGEMLGYDLLDLPFWLIRRIAAWQGDFDEHATPPGKPNDAWWERHDGEEMAIAKEIQLFLGANVTVAIERGEGWRSITELLPDTVWNLTEEYAATAFATAWNTLDPEDFLALLAHDARYASQWVFQELKSALEIADYLRGKMETIRSLPAGDPGRVRAEIGQAAQRTGGQPCVLLTQGSDDEIQAAVVFQIRGNRVSRYDLCSPEIIGATRTGVFLT